MRKAVLYKDKKVHYQQNSMYVTKCSVFFLFCLNIHVCLRGLFFPLFFLAFVFVQVKVNNEVATGTGPNKKVAKRNAAEAMLLQLGYKASAVPQNPSEVQIIHYYCCLHKLVYFIFSLYTNLPLCYDV